MKANMGTLDRVLRVIVAAAIAYLYYTGTISGPLGLALLIIAIIFVLTSLVGFCPLYAPFKMSTRKKS
jgi:hypothetical protein